jgi:hypothetical protein
MSIPKTSNNQISGLWPFYYTNREITETLKDEKGYVRNSLTVTTSTVEKTYILGCQIKSWDKILPTREETQTTWKKFW